MYFLRGFAIHGYPSVPPYPASHGCVRVPMWIAQQLYPATVRCDGHGLSLARPCSFIAPGRSAARLADALGARRGSRPRLHRPDWPDARRAFALAAASVRHRAALRAALGPAAAVLPIDFPRREAVLVAAGPRSTARTRWTSSACARSAAASSSRPRADAHAARPGAPRLAFPFRLLTSSAAAGPRVEWEAGRERRRPIRALRAELAELDERLVEAVNRRLELVVELSG